MKALATTAILMGLTAAGCASGPSDAQIVAEMQRLERACMRGNPGACSLYQAKANAIMQRSGEQAAARNAARARAGIYGQHLICSAGGC